MKIRHPGLIKLAGLLGAWVVKGLMSTVRTREWLADEYHPDKVEDQRYIYSFWHDRLIYMAGRYAHYKNVSILISHHADGELIAQACRFLGMKTVRGSTSKGGANALFAMLNEADRGHLAITPDGPRGPRHKVQPGIIYLASRTQMPIVPMGGYYRSAWYAPSWDRLGIPYPFSQAGGLAGELLHVPPDLEKSQLEPYQLELERRMKQLTEQAENWVSGKRW